MTRQAFVRDTPLLMTIDAEAHAVIDHPFRHRHRSQVAVARGAINSGSSVRSVIEPYVGFFEESVHTLPGQIFAAVRGGAQHLNSRVFRIAEGFMTSHAEVHARQAGARPAHNAGMALVAFDSDLVGVMNIVGELDRLLRFGSDVEKVFGGVSVAGMRRRECWQTPPLRRIRVCDAARISRDFGLLYTTKERRNKTEQRHPPGERIAVGTMPLHCSRKKIRSVLTLVRPLFLYFLGESI